MITLSISVPNEAAIVAQGYTTLQLQKSANKQQNGTYGNVSGASAALDATGVVSTYSLTDLAGTDGDWYAVVYTQAGGTNPTAPSAPMPGYLTDLCNAVRDVLGISVNEVSDSQLQGFAYLPRALSQCRDRVLSSSATLTFDGLIAAGGDSGNFALAALTCLMASKLCEAMKVTVADSEQLDRFKIQRNRIMDWSQTATELHSEYEQNISRAVGSVYEGAAAIALLASASVSLAGPTRAGYDTSGNLITVNDGTDGVAGGSQPVLPNDAPPPGQGPL